MSQLVHDGLAVVKPGQTYVGKQGFTYNAGASAETVGALKVCMNILPMPPGAVAKAHYHEGIETIAYLLEGQCTVYYGDQLEKRVLVGQGEQCFVAADVPHAPRNESGNSCTWIVVIHRVATRTASCCCRNWMQNWRGGWGRTRDAPVSCTITVVFRQQTNPSRRP